MEQTEILMVMADGHVTTSSADDLVLTSGGGDVAHNTSLDDVLAAMEAEHGDEADPNPMEMLNSLDTSNQNYIPQGGENYTNYGDESYEQQLQQGMMPPSDSPLSPNTLQQQQQQQYEQQQQQQQMGHFQTPMNPAPVFPPPNFDIPDISLSNSVTGVQSMYASTSGAALTTMTTAMMSHVDGKSPLRDGSSDSDDSVPLSQIATRRQVAQQAAQAAQAAQYAAQQSVQVAAPKKARSPKKGKKKKDPNEPQKPVSAYAMFFRDTQAAIKSQNPNATFGEVSKIVASMWDNLGVDCKNVYKKKTELAKKEYLKQLAVYRASLVSKQSPYDYPDQTGAAMMTSSPPGDVNKQLAQLQEMAQVASHLSSPSRLDGPMLSPQQHPQHMSPSQHMSPPQGSPQQHMSPQHMQHMSPNAQMMHLTAPEQAGQGSPMGPAGPGAPGGPGQHQQMIQPSMDPNGYPTGLPSPHHDQNGYCVRKGCQNTPLDGPNYENTYCSNECVVTHCRDVFQNWVANRQTSYASVK